MAREQDLVQEALSNYELSGELGRGAFGVVYAARHRQLGREVAVKQLPRAFAADPGVRERFVAEARMVASLDHPHIVPVYDFVDRDDGMCLIIMERCSGALSDRFTDTGLATDEACAAVLATCAALDFAHASGLLHRDIKPENLLYDSQGVVKLGDFGIARALDANARRTATGMVIGTPAYMSPEQVRGDDLTPASDVYSVGIMAYELLSGRLPFENATSATGLLAHHLVTAPTPLTASRAELPSAIGDVIDRSLAKEIEQRHATAEELARDLTAACVASFGTGWIRRRRFVLHWPEMIAESERPRDGGERTGTIVVRADDSRTALVAAKGGEAVEDQPAAGPVPAPDPSATIAPTGQPTVAPRAGVAGVPSTPLDDLPTADPVPPPAPPPPNQPTPTGPPPGAFPSAQPQYAPPPPNGTAGSRGLVAVLAIAAVAVLGVVAFLVTSGGDDGGDGELAGGTTTLPRTESSTTLPGAPATTPTSTSPEDNPFATTTTIPVPTTRPPTAFGVGDVADSWIAPTPCPVGPQRTACIVAGVSVDDETGEVTVLYETTGFSPELEPADYHVHFYFDTAVDGDERKAGSEVPGGSWKPWDDLLFESFGGSNGRTGFTAADAAAADARYLCVIVSDADQVAVPGSGNCAPFVRQDDQTILVEQLDRLVGTYIGTCAMGATLIVPPDWRWIDLTTAEVAEAARLLRPTDTANAEAVLSELIASGGVLWADGPVIDGVIVNLTVTRVEGDYTTADEPAAIRDKLAQSGLAFGDSLVEKPLNGLVINTQTIDNGATTSLQYAVPDFGYVNVVTITVPASADLEATADAIAATVLGC